MDKRIGQGRVLLQFTGAGGVTYKTEAYNVIADGQDCGSLTRHRDIEGKIRWSFRTRPGYRDGAATTIGMISTTRTRRAALWFLLPREVYNEIFVK